MPAVPDDLEQCSHEEVAMAIGELESGVAPVELSVLPCSGPDAAPMGSWPAVEGDREPLALVANRSARVLVDRQRSVGAVDSVASCGRCSVFPHRLRVSLCLVCLCVKTYTVITVQLPVQYETNTEYCSISRILFLIQYVLPSLSH